ncbi:hypothetical protein V8G54_028380 [Vigna mungo]|uniref:(S)-ureidoglycine aminohydrolase cupin domain-containing protein n=1 Tax=Vigna mungo TaxID=3915 RepID=A0AAQ3MSV9_VIGMU
MASSFVGTLFPNNFTQTKHSAVPLRRVSTRGRLHLTTVAESMTTVIEKLGIKIERNPPESKLTQLGVRKWPNKFPWTYEAKETCYLLEGKVKVFPSGSNESVEIAAGDLVVFPKGMSCTWDVSVGVDKHYKFE